MYNYQNSMQASHKIGMAIVGLVLFTSTKSVAIIVRLSLKWVYLKLKHWIFIKLDGEKWNKINEELMKKEQAKHKLKATKIQKKKEVFRKPDSRKKDPAIQKVIVRKKPNRKSFSTHKPMFKVRKSSFASQK